MEEKPVEEPKICVLNYQGQRLLAFWDYISACWAAEWLCKHLGYAPTSTVVRMKYDIQIEVNIPRSEMAPPLKVYTLNSYSEGVGLYAQFKQLGITSR